jgi:hypothetical protein
MKNLLVFTLIFSVISPVFQENVSNVDHNRGTAAVILAGGILDKRENIEKKYPRKDCPVCKGKGWYISGDGIAKVDCGYCEEPEKELFELEINPATEEKTEEKEQDKKLDEPPLVPIEKEDSEVVQDPESKKIIIYRR